MNFEAAAKIIDLTPYPRPALFSAEEKKEACDELLKFLLKEAGLIAAFSASFEKKRQLVRGYMNRRMPLPIPPDILPVQDGLFWTESVERGIVSIDDLSPAKGEIYLWEGDIRRLAADAIVNAANGALLGCFQEGHTCIDNVIHSAAGMQLRDDCARLMAARGREVEAGETEITRAYNLPAKYVLHTVGPMVRRTATAEERAALRSCYLTCLDLAEEAKLNSVAFCCVATGVFSFPREEAAEIAVGSVARWKMRNPSSKMKVVFNTFLPEDTKTYSNILKIL